MKVYGELMEHGEVVSHPTVVDEGDELARRFIIRASAREALEQHAAAAAIRRAAATRSRPLCFFYRHYPGKRPETAMRGRYLGPVALIGPHGRSSWWVRFGGRAYLCATEHLRGVTLDEADRLGLDERRQLEELLKAPCEVPKVCEDWASQRRLPPPVEIPTEPPREPKETVRDDLDIGMDAIEPMDPSEEAGEAASSTEIEVQSSPWKGLGASFGQHALGETPFAEAAGSPRFNMARLEKPLEDEPEENVEDETGLIGPDDVLTTKSQGAPSSSTRSSILDKRQYDCEISFNQLPERYSLEARSSTCSMG